MNRTAGAYPNLNKLPLLSFVDWVDGSWVEGLWSSLKDLELANLTSSTLAEVIDQAHKGIDRVRRIPHLAYSFLRHAGLSVA